jgi:hypothetical protein
LINLDDIFNSMVLDWSSHDNGFLDSVPLQPDTSTAEPSNDDGNTACSNGDENFIRILQHEPTPRPQPSPYYLGHAVPDALHSPDVFLQLTNILVTLEGLARHIPSFRVHDEEQLQRGTSSTSSAEVDHDYGVSKAFAITSTLADVYIPLLEQTRQRKSRNPASESIESTESTESTESLCATDYSTLHLLFACHHRLIDQWAAMLRHAEMVHKKDSPDAKARASRCAQFSLGSYVPSSSATVVPMEIIVVQELAMHLASRLGELISIVSPGTDADADADVEVEVDVEVELAEKSIVLSGQALHGRAMGMRAEIARLKGALENATRRHA